LEHPVASYAGAFPVEGILVEGCLPSVLVGNRVLDLQDVHPWRSLP
jgi:hypothetical protein